MTSAIGTKIFVGNLSSDATAAELTELFSQFGEVTKCDRLKQFAFVFMADEDEANTAIKELSGYRLHNMKITVQLSTRETQGRGGNIGGRSGGGGGGSTKIFIGNLPMNASSAQVVPLFEEFGKVIQGDVLEGQGYGFIHMATEEDAAHAIKSLHGHPIDGKNMTVELATNTYKRGRGNDGGGRKFERRDHGSHRYEPYHDLIPPSRRLPAPPSLSHVSSLLSDLSRTSLQLQSSSLFTPSLQLLAPPSASSLGFSSTTLELESALRRVPAVQPQQRPTTTTSSNSGESFARELLKFYLKNPTGFDAYARDPLVRSALDLDDDREGLTGVGGAYNMTQTQTVMTLPTLSQSNGGGQLQQQQQQQYLYEGSYGSRY